MNYCFDYLIFAFRNFWFMISNLVFKNLFLKLFLLSLTSGGCLNRNYVGKACIPVLSLLARSYTQQHWHRTCQSGVLHRKEKKGHRQINFSLKGLLKWRERRNRENKKNNAPFFPQSWLALALKETKGKEKKCETNKKQPFLHIS